MDVVGSVDDSAVEEKMSGAVIVEGASSPAAADGGTSAPSPSSADPATPAPAATEVGAPAPGEDLTKVRDAWVDRNWWVAYSVLLLQCHRVRRV